MFLKTPYDYQGIDSSSIHVGAELVFQPIPFPSFKVYAVDFVDGCNTTCRAVRCDFDGHVELFDQMLEQWQAEMDKDPPWARAVVLSHRAEDYFQSDRIVRMSFPPVR